jgi:hypothetical protein
VGSFTGRDPATLANIARVRVVADPDRKGGGGLSARTLAIASAASLTAAMVTSRVFPPGTVYASALTPIIVTAVSELLNRPVDAVSELRKQRRTLVRDQRTLEAARILGEEPHPLRGAPEFAQGADAEQELAANGNAEPPPMRIHGRRRYARRILHPKVWIATGLAGFAIAVAVLTLPELIFGGAVTTTHRTTFFGGRSSSSSSSNKQDTTTSTTPSGSKTQTQTTVTETVPSKTQSQTQSQTTTTSTQTSPTGTGTSTSPSGGAAPQSTDTATTPAPSGVDTPP